MQTIWKNWSSLKCYQRAATLVGLLCSVSIIVLAILQIFDVWKSAIYALQPLMAIMMLAQAVQYWQSNRKTAVFSLVTAIFLLVAAAIIWFARGL